MPPAIAGVARGYHLFSSMHSVFAICPGLTLCPDLLLGKTELRGSLTVKDKLVFLL